MAVKTYSLKKDGNKKLSENFRVREFRSRDGADKILIDEKLVSLLQKMRDKFGAVSISSAYRTVAYNRKVGGVSNSQHLYGLAADVTIKDNSRLPEAAQYAEKIGFRGVGLDDKHQNCRKAYDIHQCRQVYQQEIPEETAYVDSHPQFGVSADDTHCAHQKVQQQKDADCSPHLSKQIFGIAQWAHIEYLRSVKLFVTLQILRCQED
jgi:hypothetical protein